MIFLKQVNGELTGPDCQANFIDHTPAKPDVQKKSSQRDLGSGSGSPTGWKVSYFTEDVTVSLLTSTTNFSPTLFRSEDRLESLGFPLSESIRYIDSRLRFDFRESLVKP